MNTFDNIQELMHKLNSWQRARKVVGNLKPDDVQFSAAAIKLNDAEYAVLLAFNRCMYDSNKTY